MKIRKYHQRDIAKLNNLLVRDPDWTLYTAKESWNDYVKVLADSEVFIFCHNNEIIGFIRFRLDGPFGVYIYDLLVDKAYRGHGYGKQLIDAVCHEYPHDDIYVMSDNNEYYKKVGLAVEGMVFRVQTADK